MKILLQYGNLQDYSENIRLLVSSFYSNYMAIPKMKAETATELRRFYHVVRSIVEALVDRLIQSNEDMFVCWTSELLDLRTRSRWEDSVSRSRDPMYAELMEFLECRLHTLEAMQGSKLKTNTGKSTE